MFNSQKNVHVHRNLAGDSCNHNIMIFFFFNFFILEFLFIYNSHLGKGIYQMIASCAQFLSIKPQKPVKRQIKLIEK